MNTAPFRVNDTVVQRERGMEMKSLIRSRYCGKMGSICQWLTRSMAIVRIEIWNVFLTTTVCSTIFLFPYF